ncbi:MAG: hypothetical protein ACYCTV_05030 [Leptospirales bacterium]
MKNPGKSRNDIHTSLSGGPCVLIWHSACFKECLPSIMDDGASVPEGGKNLIGVKLLPYGMARNAKISQN